MSILPQIIELRNKAVQEALASSPSFATIRALDDAVAAAGGARLFAAKGAEKTSLEIVRPSNAAVQAIERIARVSQGDAAERALKQAGQPLPVGRLMEQATELGAMFGGEKPIVSFRSTLSKDNRFYSFMRNGMYFWWLTDVELPGEWKEAASPDLVDQLAASNSNQEGGVDHAANVTPS